MSRRWICELAIGAATTRGPPNDARVRDDLGHHWCLWEVRLADRTDFTDRIRSQGVIGPIGITFGFALNTP
jgi:hypothetical protein